MNKQHATKAVGSEEENQTTGGKFFSWRQPTLVS